MESLSCFSTQHAFSMFSVCAHAELAWVPPTQGTCYSYRRQHIPSWSSPNCRVPWPRDKWELEQWKTTKDVLQRRKSIKGRCAFVGAMKIDMIYHFPWSCSGHLLDPWSLSPSSQITAGQLLVWDAVLWTSAVIDSLGLGGAVWPLRFFCFWAPFLAVPAASALQKLWSLNPSSTNTLTWEFIRCLFEFLQYFSLKLWDLTSFILSLCFFNSFLIFPQRLPCAIVLKHKKTALSSGGF